MTPFENTKIVEKVNAEIDHFAVSSIFQKYKCRQFSRYALLKYAGKNTEGKNQEFYCTPLWYTPDKQRRF